MKYLKNIHIIIKVAAAIAGVSLLSFFATGQPIALMLGFALGCAGISYKYPHWVIWALLIYLPFAGTVTYWIGWGNLIFNFYGEFA